MLNKIIKPMLLTESNDIPNTNKYIFEIKFDGIRALIYIINNTIKIFTKSGKNITNLFPEFINLTTTIKDNCILDGEIICLTNNKPDFFKVQERIHLKNIDKINFINNNTPSIYICFDVLYFNKDITKQPLYKRKIILNNIKDNNYLIKSKVFDDGEILFNSIKKMDLEGIVCKNKFSEYEINTRSKNWIKVKNYKIGVFYIGAYVDGNKNRFSIYLGEKINNKLYYVGKVFVSKRDRLYEKLRLTKNSTNHFEQYIENVNFVVPNIKIKVKYIGKKNNHLREAFYIN